MPTSEPATATLAILIDAENANPAIIKGLIDEVAIYGAALNGKQVQTHFEAARGSAR